MYIKPKSVLSTLLTVFMVFSLFSMMPITANAIATLSEVIDQINSFNPGSGSTGTLETFSPTGSSIIYVSGTVTGATNALELNYDSNVTIRWGANYSGNVAVNPMILLTGSGTFEVGAGGSIINSGAGNAIYSSGNNATINVSGGSVSAKEDYSAICIDASNSTVNVTGGTIDGGRHAISDLTGSNNNNAFNVTAGTLKGGIALFGQASSIVMSGGIVINATDGADGHYGAIFIRSGSTVTITGGTVIYYGTTPIIMSQGTPAISGTAVVCGWDKYSGPLTYTEGTSDYLNVAPSVASATWGKNGSQSGINYANGSNTGFLAISGVTVNAVGISPTITGLTTMTLAQGYAATTTGVYTISGTPAPTVTKESGNTAITWDSTNNKFNISAGLTAGTYPVVLKVSNGVNPDAELTFTLTVTQAPEPPSITGSTTIELEDGYSATSTDAYTIIGTPAPTVTKESGDAAITWNDSAQKLDIAAGLAAGTYPIVLKATNSAGESSMLITLTVSEAFDTAYTGMSNFTKVNAYARGQFTDVNETLWYGYDEQRVIATAYEYGLMLGTSDTLFDPTGNVTIAQAVTMASRVHKIYSTGNGDFVQGSVWYQVYVDYALANDIIAANDFTDYNKTATRAEMAYIFSKALPATEFASQNTVNSLPDVNSGTPYYSAILTLYKAGVIAGSDTQGTFNPSNNITRAEAAAIISRVILPATRFSGKTF